MQMAELTALLTPEGLRLLEQLPPIDSTTDVARAVSTLRAAGHSPDLVSAVVGQARLRTRAQAKFGDHANRMLFTRTGLEQATRLALTTRHAARFLQAGMQHVADLGCGIGADSLGLAGLGLTVTAIDSDEVTAAIAAYNLAVFGDSVTVRHHRAEDFSDEVDAAWLDPARRIHSQQEHSRDAHSPPDSGRSRTEEWSPPLPWVLSFAQRVACGIKLGPGLDRELIPNDAEAQWISVDGSTVELVLWTGVLARPEVRRAALVTRGEASWELVAREDAPDEPVQKLGEYLHEPAGSVIRARLIGEVARALEAGMLADKIAYLTSDTALTSPFVSTFRIRERLPVDRKPLAAALRARNIGTLEIKKRGVDVDPAQLRTALKLRGDESATLILTRIAGKRVALLAERIPA